MTRGPWSTCFEDRGNISPGMIISVFVMFVFVFDKSVLIKMNLSDFIFCPSFKRPMNFSIANHLLLLSLGFRYSCFLFR